MKLLNIRTFSGRTLDQILRFLQADLSAFLKDLQAGASRLTFADNFQSFRADFTVAAGAVAEIPNRLGAIDLEWVMVDVQGESSIVRDPDTPWTANFVYLKNVGAVSVTASARFFRGQ